MFMLGCLIFISTFPCSLRQSSLQKEWEHLLHIFSKNILEFTHSVTTLIERDSRLAKESEWIYSEFHFDKLDCFITINILSLLH